MKINANIINAILRRDSKDATYKYALLRALVQTVTEQSAHKRVSENPFCSDPSDFELGVGGTLRKAPFTVRYPLGIIVWYWLQYYYPIFAHPHFIPQKNGETSQMSDGRTLAIRRPFGPVINYYASRGGFAQLHYDLLKNEVPNDIRPSLLELLRRLSDIIVKMPMKYMGYSVFSEHYSLVNAKRTAIRGLSYSSLVSEAGWVYIHPELYEVIDELGGLLVGDDSIISGWAEFTSSLSDRTGSAGLITQEHVLSLLRFDPIGQRDVFLAKKVLDRSHPQCVWTGRQPKPMHIDHMLPYSVTRNNGLWNLVPVLNSVNLRKSDKIPDPELISKCEQRIEHVWNLFSSEYDSLFWQEVYEGLGVSKEQGVQGAIQSLQHRCDYLINTRGFEAFRV